MAKRYRGPLAKKGAFKRMEKKHGWSPGLTAYIMRKNLGPKRLAAKAAAGRRAKRR